MGGQTNPETQLKCTESKFQLSLLLLEEIWVYLFLPEFLNYSRSKGAITQFLEGWVYHGKAYKMGCIAQGFPHYPNIAGGGSTAAEAPILPDNGPARHLKLNEHIPNQQQNRTVKSQHRMRFSSLQVSLTKFAVTNAGSDQILMIKSIGFYQ